ncbi:MAG: hypothetical protein Fur009_5300 [Candidatus Microgenomates bacterium]
MPIKLINNNKISYKEFGQGTPLFLLPPYPSSSSAFYPFINYCLNKKTNVHFIAIDLPGFGGYSELKKEILT